MEFTNLIKRLWMSKKHVAKPLLKCFLTEDEGLMGYRH